ncbi:MAG TPA: secretin N-terminal domain-containing protein [Chthoniobacterales bacterium]|nr:secretin N-terminal domain-containing protein [Chthoniobacterales bacterium]
MVVSDVLAQYASLTHWKIIKDNFVEGKICLDDISKFPSEKAVEIIERTLFSNGYAITQIDADIVEITGFGRSPRTIGIPVIRDAKALPAHERLVSFIFRFKHRDAVETGQLFGQYLSPPQAWTQSLADPKSNTLVVTERTSVIRKLIDIVKELDVPDQKKQP